MAATATPRRLAAPPLPRRGGGRHETVLFVLGVAVIAVHVLDDNYVAPQPGTSAADHLVSGLVPLAVLALAAWAYPRLRGGRRGALALVLGVLGIAAGIEAVDYTRKVGASGDDFTGLLTIPAGLMLLGLGGVTLWRTRRTEGNRAWRYARRVLLGAAGVVAVYAVVLPIGLAYVTTHVGRAVVPPNQLGVAYENVSFTTSDGLKLEGWYVPSKNGAAVIAFLQRRPDGRIGGIGLSVGGELMLETAADTDALKAVVSEGAGARAFSDELDHDVSALEKWTSAPYYAVKTASVGVFANQSPPTNLKHLVGKIALRPLFLIAAPNSPAGEDLNRGYFKAAGEPKTLWEIPESGHVGGLSARPGEYERRVVSFFDAALLR